jgi:pantoate kinase
MQRSRSFTEHVGLATPRLRRIFRHMDAHGFIFTMAMFGEVAYTVVEKERAEEAATELTRADPGCLPMIVGIDEAGAHLV